MRKQDELLDPSSCLNKSQDDEYIFVLTARDPHAPRAVRQWADSYERAGGRPEKVREARQCAFLMEKQRAKITDL